MSTRNASLSSSGRGRAQQEQRAAHLALRRHEQQAAGRRLVTTAAGLNLGEQNAIAGLFNPENPAGSERIALAEALADTLLGERAPNPDHFAAPAK